MRVAITGTTGRVGAALANHFSGRHEVIALPRGLFDLADPDGMAALLDSLECDVFFNPAGLTGLEACEDNPALAHRLNAAAPAELAAWAAARGVRLFHFSTDYVFSGETPGFRTEDELASPLSVYGRSKRAGEDAVLAHPGTCVVRVSWVFGPEKPSFVDLILRRALAGEPLSAIADKYSLPTHTGDLARWMEVLAESGVTGTIHACQSGEPVSWHGMAGAVIEELMRSGRLDTLPEIEATALDDTVAFRAARPRHTAMATNRLAACLPDPIRGWREAVQDYTRECR